MKKIIKENFIKNIFIVVALICAYNPLKKVLSEIKTEQISDFLLIISILLVTVSFANFAFNYKDINIKNNSHKLLSYASTFIFMLLTGLLLESMVIIMSLIYAVVIVNIFFIFSILLYVSIVLYDFWDLLRNK